MKVAHIICSIKNLNNDYSHLQWLRMFFLSNSYTLSEDWINHSLVIRNNKPRFQPAPDFDYMKVAMDAIHTSDVIIFLMTEPSTFTTTMLRYAQYTKKHCIVITRNKTVIEIINQLEHKEFVKKLDIRTYQRTIKKELL